jgi:hypothetical protein
MAETGSVPQVPAYYNLGFVLLNRPGLEVFSSRIFEVQRAIKQVVDSHMRCQIAVSLIAYEQGLDIDALPASYNAANDLVHQRHNYLSVEDIRVLHYLRTDEIERSLIFQEEHIEGFLAAELANPVNRALQALGRDYRRRSL